MRPDPLYGDLNYTMLYTMVKAASEGRYDVLESFGYDLTLVNHISEMKVKDFILLVKSPGCFIDTHSKEADNVALRNMMSYAQSIAKARDVVDELIRRGAMAVMIRAVERSLDYEDHAWKRKLMGIKTHAGRPRNVDDETLARIETAWDSSADFRGTLAERFIKICDETDLGADTIWTALRQIVELRPANKLDPVLESLPLNPKL